MKLKIKLLSILLAPALLPGNKALAVTFDTSLLAGASGKSDLSRFYLNNDIPAGKQTIDVYVNKVWKGRFSLLFGERRGDIRISAQDAELLGINITELSSAPGGNSLLEVKNLSHGGGFDFDVSTMSLHIMVPQSRVRRGEAGYVDAKFWDHGVPALLLAYNSTYYNIKPRAGNGPSYDDFYTGLESGVNIAGWQFRDSSSLRHSSRQGSRWQNNTRYLQRGFAAIKSNLTVGDFYSPGDLFDSIRVRGGALASDINMRPNSQQNFSPIVRGVARSNALVQVLQNGRVIYQENVPPGAFTLDNILPTGSAGDLLVVVKEADGREQSFVVPFSTVPGMLKEGVSKYSLVAGKVRQTSSDYAPAFMQGTLHYGFNNLFTGYVGTILSEEYRSWLLGSSWNLPIGALSVDVTQASTSLNERRENGQSFRIAYSNFLDTTDTYFTLAAYRYATRGYYSFNDAIYAIGGYKQRNRKIRDYLAGPEGDEDLDPLDLNSRDAVRAARPRNTFSLNLNQRLADGWGTLYFSGSQRDYWSETDKSREYQLGYSNSFAGVSYNLSASRVRNVERKEETRLYLSLSVPLSVFDNKAYLSAGLSTKGSRYQQSTLSLSGNALESNRLSYALSGSNQSHGDSMASVNAAWRGNGATVGASYSESADYRQSGLSARGSLVAIPWHLLASNEIGSTMMVVDAPGAKGLVVNGDSSIVTNDKGLALVPYATPYRQNSVTLSDTGQGSGAEIVGNIANSVPYAGAINYLRFETDRRLSYRLRAYQAGGKPLPFGTSVVDEQGHNVGSVGQASVLYLKAEQLPASLKVSWRDGSCRILSPKVTMDAAANICR